MDEQSLPAKTKVPFVEQIAQASIARWLSSNLIIPGEAKLAATRNYDRLAREQASIARWLSNHYWLRSKISGGEITIAWHANNHSLITGVNNQLLQTGCRIRRRY